MAKKKEQEGGTNSFDDYVTQSDAAARRGVDLSVLNAWVRRGRVRSKEVFGRRVVYLPDVMSYEPEANKGGRPPTKKEDGKGSK